VERINISVRAMDRVEQYGEWGTNFIFIDKQTLEFTNFFPGPDEWFNTLTPEAGITISDVGGRFVIGSSIEYSVSYDGGVTFGDWISAGSVLNAKDLVVSVEPALMEGSENMIKFKAADEAGNLVESDAHQINVDISGVIFGNLTVDGSEDWEDQWLENGEVDIGITISDLLSGVKGDSMEYRLTHLGRSDLNSANWMPVDGSTSDNEISILLENVMLGYGDTNYIQFRAKGVLENPFLESPAFNLWINTEPVPVISSPEDDAEFLEGDMITFDASFSRDYDGDALTYTWSDTFNEETTVIGEGVVEDFERFDWDALEPGTHSIVLMVSDGIHEISSNSIEIFIEDYVFPIWKTDQDQDNDGMPNWFEFNFHLGWEDSSNKDTIYNPATDSSKTKSELWELFKSEYSNQTVQVTAANDFDGDGHTDFEEYLADTDPTDESSYPVYAPPGETEDSPLNLLLLLAIIISILLIIAIIVFLAINNMAIKNKLEEEAVKDAENEQAMLEQAMLAGGAARLDALKAASEGRPVALPTAPPTDVALPEAPAGAETAQPMEATPMGQPQPVEPEPAPAPQPIDAQGGFPPQ
jgi:type II secretory pathway pseudopilin PulG